MALLLFLGIGAGLVSALLFAAIGTNSVPAMLLMYLAPLPVLIVALGWNHLLGLLALAAGGLATSLLLRPTVAIAFALGPALSAWSLAYLSLLARPAAPARAPHAGGADPWYPVGKLLLWIGVAGAAIALCALASASGGEYGRYRNILEQAASAFLRSEARVGRSGPLPQMLGIPGVEVVRLIVGLAPAMMAGFLTVVLAVNLWLAGKAVSISGRLVRPWPDIASARMPVAAIAAVAAALLAGQVHGFAGVAGMALAGGLLMAFALQGLALLHDVSRQRPGRGLILSVAYFMTVVLVYVVLPAFALLGIADTALPLRTALGRGPPRPPSA